MKNNRYVPPDLELPFEAPLNKEELPCHLPVYLEYYPSKQNSDTGQRFFREFCSFYQHILSWFHNFDTFTLVFLRALGRVGRNNLLKAVIGSENTLVMSQSRLVTLVKKVGAKPERKLFNHLKELMITDRFCHVEFVLGSSAQFPLNSDTAAFINSYECKKWIVDDLGPGFSRSIGLWFLHDDTGTCVPNKDVYVPLPSEEIPTKLRDVVYYNPKKTGKWLLIHRKCATQWNLDDDCEITTFTLKFLGVLNKTTTVEPILDLARAEISWLVVPLGTPKTCFSHRRLLQQHCGNWFISKGFRLSRSPTASTALYFFNTVEVDHLSVLYETAEGRHIPGMLNYIKGYVESDERTCYWPEILLEKRYLVQATNTYNIPQVQYLPQAPIFINDSEEFPSNPHLEQ